MYADLDYNHPEVKDDVKNWAVWLGKEINLRGLRFDAVKHVSPGCITNPELLLISQFSEDFLKELLQTLDKAFGTGWFFVGEVGLLA